MKGRKEGRRETKSKAEVRVVSKGIMMKWFCVPSRKWADHTKGRRARRHSPSFLWRPKGIALPLGSNVSNGIEHTQFDKYCGRHTGTFVAKKYFFLSLTRTVREVPVMRHLAGKLSNWHLLADVFLLQCVDVLVFWCVGVSFLAKNKDAKKKKTKKMTERIDRREIQVLIPNRQKRISFSF